jgi:hypothetical protein
MVLPSPSISVCGRMVALRVKQIFDYNVRFGGNEKTLNAKLWWLLRKSTAQNGGRLGL